MSPFSPDRSFPSLLARWRVRAFVLHLALVVLTAPRAAVAQEPAWAKHCTVDSVWEFDEGKSLKTLLYISGNQGLMALHPDNKDRSPESLKPTKLSDISYISSMTHPSGPPTPAVIGHFTNVTNGDSQKAYFVIRPPDQAGYVTGYWGWGDLGSDRPGNIRNGAVDGKLRGVLQTVAPPAAVASFADSSTHCIIESVWKADDGTSLKTLLYISGDHGLMTFDPNDKDRSVESAAPTELLNISYVASMTHPTGLASPAVIGHFTNGINGGYKKAYFVIHPPNQAGSIEGYWGWGDLGKDRQGNIRSGDVDGKLSGVLQTVAALAPPPQIGEEQPAIFNALPEAVTTGPQGPAVSDAWLEKSRRLGQAVGQLVTDDGTAYGVCFLVADGVALTAKHVLTAIGTQHAAARFQKPSEATFVTFEFAEPPTLIEPDIGIVILKSSSDVQWPPVISLPNGAESQFTVKNMELIHFPRNEGRRYDFHGIFLDPRTTTIYRYTTPTEPGSSGAPIFDFSLNLVAIHYGSPRHELGRAVPYNYGYRIDYVVRRLREELRETSNGQRLLSLMGVAR
jgi:hypothetical protein